MRLVVGYVLCLLCIWTRFLLTTLSSVQKAAMQRGRSSRDQVWHVGGCLIQEAERVFKEHGKLTEEILSALHFVYQGPLLSALELVDKCAVSHLISPSGRDVYQVIGSSGTPYTCLTTSHYCSCPAFTFSVLHKEDHMMCKHHLAVRLSNIMGKTKTVNISDQHLASMLSALE